MRKTGMGNGENDKMNRSEIDKITLYGFGGQE